MYRMYRKNRDKPDAPDRPALQFPDRAAAWECLRHLLQQLFAFFGSPERLAKLGGVSPDWRRDFLSWLVPCERLARILLLAEAAHLKVKLRKLIRRRRARYHPLFKPRLRNPPTTPSETWRDISFKVLPSPSARTMNVREYHLPRFDHLPLAKRFEALVRVLLDPMPYASRLAHRLLRKPAPRLRRRVSCGRWLENPMEWAPTAALHLAEPAFRRFGIP